MVKRYRVGIDVGGTFTHTVAIDTQTLTVAERVKVPTTHRAAEGVARGIVDSLMLLLDRIPPEEISLIAYSTTQATNALLEGDVATVGILGMGKGWLAESATRVSKIQLSPGRYLHTHHRFLKGEPTDTEIREALKSLVSEGAQALVVSAAFSVDDPTLEHRALAIAEEFGLPVTAGCDISQLYGLRARTRTAVINASMLPKMIESANLTEESVRKAGIQAPLMIMRSDGGVMDLAEMRRRPILTMLSGPAAGVAAAMMYLRLSDGIFLEVGGTSTDISTIRNGKALVQSAEIGGNRIYLRTLDVKTVGIAGGSLPRIRGRRILDVGPRSAHIAGLAYSAFGQEPLGEMRLVAPLPRDPEDYLALGGVAITPTCASNYLGLVPDSDCAKGDPERIQTAFARLGASLHLEPQEAATQILERASQKAIGVVERLIADYKLDRRMVTLVGGGGGSAAIVPYVAKKLNLPFSLAENADVLSAIGVGLAMVRDCIERTVMNPNGEDLARIRREAEQSVVRMGANPNTVEVHIEVDSKRNLVRATATGATELRTKDLSQTALSEKECQSVAAKSLGATPEVLAEAGAFRAFGQTVRRKTRVRVVDVEGVIRLQTNQGIVKASTVGQVARELVHLAEEHASYNDGGKTLPDLFILYGNKILDLTGLLTAEHASSLTQLELEGLPPDQPVLLLASLR